MSDIMSNDTPPTSLSSPFPFAKQHKKRDCKFCNLLILRAVDEA